MGKGFATYDKVRELACKKMLTVSDKKVFLHPTMTSYIRGILEGMIHRYNKRASFPGKIEWKPDEPHVAYTDGNRWVCNAGNPFFSKAKSTIKSINDRNYRILLVTAAGIHETGHKLYTNSHYEKNFIYSKLLATGTLFPSPTIESEDWTKLQEMLEEKRYLKTFIYLYKNITNALEDGYIEYRLLDDFPHPSNKNALMALRAHHYSSMPSLKDNIANEAGDENKKLFSIINILLGYAKYGQLKCDKSEYSDERIQAVVNCIPYIDECNDCFSPYGHYQAMNNVIAILSPYILAYFNDAEEEGKSDEDTEKEAGDSLADDVKASDKDMERSEMSEDMPMAPVPDGEDSDSDKDGSSEMSDSEDDGESTSDEKSSADSGEIGGDEDGLKEKRTTESKEKPDLDDEVDYSSLCSEDATTEYVSVDEEDKDWEEITKIAKDIIAEQAKEEAIEELEEEHISSLRKEDAEADYGSLHTGRGCRIERQKTVSESQKDAYDKLANEYLPLSKAANREYIKKIKELNEEDIMRGRYSGQFDVTGAYRPDKRMFSKKRLPSPVSLSIFLLIDESGSMCGSRIEMARITAIIIEEFCRLTGIRLCVMGHTEDFDRKRDVVLTNYKDFDSIDKNDRYRLMNIAAKENNRDGYALRYAMNHIKKETSDVKLIINISDGAPEADGYRGRSAVNELQSIVKECERNNISVISAAIGSDRDTIKEIYGKGFLNISDLNMLPKTLIALIKKYMPDA